MPSKRIRDRKYLRFVATFGKCLVCGTEQTISPHHLLKVPSEPNAMGLKAGDNWCVPLCHKHHVGDEGVHRYGDETTYFAQHGIDPLPIAENLYSYYLENKEAFNV